MSTPAAPVPASPRRRRIWPWILALFCAPFLLLGAVVLSYVTLDRDAAALRRNVAAATGDDWHTRFQCSVGGLTLGAIRTGLMFVHDGNVADARLALGAVQRASVGVYERDATDRPEWSGPELLARTDQAMGARGWTRMIGVVERKETVLVYMPTAYTDGDEIDLCVAVVNGRELVVVSTTVASDDLARLIESKAGPELKGKLHLAKL